MTVNKFYAGIGSTKTPEHIQEKMTEIAKLLEIKRYTLRSGGATGADTAFENGVRHRKEIFYQYDYILSDAECVPYAKSELKFSSEMCDRFHPIGKKLRGRTRDLISRNTFQIFGIGDTQNVDFVICYTQDGSEGITSQLTGGTGQALRIAKAYHIPIYNLKNYIGISPNEFVEFVLKNVNNI